MAARKVKVSDLKSWIKNYESYVKDEYETRSCLISLGELRALVDYIDTQNGNNANPIDGVRVYFIRPKHRDQHHKRAVSLSKRTIKKEGGKIYQMSIVMAPTFGYAEYYEPSRKVKLKDPEKKFEERDHAGAKIYKETNEVFVVFPGGNENSGLCPPNCEEPIGPSGPGNS